MDFFENVCNKCSCKDFKSDIVPHELIEKIANAGSCASSGRNSQSPIIIVIKSKEMRDKIARLNSLIMGTGEDFDPFYNAPVIMVVLAKKDVPTHVYDGSLVLGNMMLAANECGLGSCWIHRAKEEFETDFGKSILKSLNITDEYEGIGHLALGYRSEKYEAQVKPRKDNYIYYID